MNPGRFKVLQTPFSVPWESAPRHYSLSATSSLVPHADLGRDLNHSCRSATRTSPRGHWHVSRRAAMLGHVTVERDEQGNVYEWTECPMCENYDRHPREPSGLLSCALCNTSWGTGAK